MPFTPQVYRSLPQEPETTQQSRLHELIRAGFNVGNVDAETCVYDGYSDSGTGPLDEEQRAAMELARAHYAGGRTSRELFAQASEVFGFDEHNVVLAPQGRGVEYLFYQQLFAGRGRAATDVPRPISVSNTHFDTTRGHVLLAGGQPVDLPDPNAWDDTGAGEAAFGGNIDIAALQALLEGPHGAQVRCCVLTLPNNGTGGQPVHPHNVREARRICHDHDVLLVLDSARFAENAYLVQQRDPQQYGQGSVADIAREIHNHADGVMLSCKKDVRAHGGGLLLLRDTEFVRQCRRMQITVFGGAWYGGLAPETMAQVAVGLRLATREPDLRLREAFGTWANTVLREADVPVVRPPACHAVYVNAGTMMPKVPAMALPGQRLVWELYVLGGIRAVDLGEFGLPGTRRQLVRIALPRGAADPTAIWHIADVFAEVLGYAHVLRGCTLLSNADDPLRQFTATLAPQGDCGVASPWRKGWEPRAAAG
jgi:tryptophanase